MPTIDRLRPSAFWTGKGKLLPKLLNLPPGAVSDLGKRENVAPDLALLALEQVARLRAVEEPPASPNRDLIGPFQGAVMRDLRRLCGRRSLWEHEHRDAAHSNGMQPRGLVSKLLNLPPGAVSDLGKSEFR